MKTPLLLGLTALAPGAMFGQIIQSSEFFDPDFKVRRTQSPGILTLTVNNTPVSQTQASGNTSWTQSAGGHAQVGAELLFIPVADVQLAAYSQTVGDSLVFGREITASVLGSGGDGLLAGLINNVAGASVLYSWDSTATVSGLAIVPDQLYQVSFMVTSGAGLPVDVLSAATFGITNPEVTGASDESAELLNLLGLVSVGAVSDSGLFTFQFKSSQALSSLDFNFAATTGVGVSLLGGTANNQNVLTFSGFSVEAIPEPSSVALSGVFVGLLALRRRRRA